MIAVCWCRELVGSEVDTNCEMAMDDCKCDRRKYNGLRISRFEQIVSQWAAAHISRHSTANSRFDVDVYCTQSESFV